MLCYKCYNHVLASIKNRMLWRDINLCISCEIFVMSKLDEWVTFLHISLLDNGYRNVHCAAIVAHGKGFMTIFGHLMKYYKREGYTKMLLADACKLSKLDLIKNLVIEHNVQITKECIEYACETCDVSTVAVLSSLNTCVNMNEINPQYLCRERSAPIIHFLVKYCGYDIYRHCNSLFKKAHEKKYYGLADYLASFLLM
jgi:hypothetical protein